MGKCDSGETKRGAVRYLQGRYEDAKQHYLAAHAVYSKGNDIHPSTSSTEVRLGSIAMQQGFFEEAQYVNLRWCQVSDLTEANACCSTAIGSRRHY